jgi:hypothetical protein
MKTQHPALAFSLAACVAAMLVLGSGSARAAEPASNIEQMLGAAQQEKRSVMLYVGGQAIGGAVLRIEPGRSVELRNQQYGRILVRLDRVDAVAQP